VTTDGTKISGWLSSPSFRLQSYRRGWQLLVLVCGLTVVSILVLLLSTSLGILEPAINMHNRSVVS